MAGRAWREQLWVPEFCLLGISPYTEWEGSEIHGIGVCEPLTKVLLRYLNLSVN